MAFPQDFALFGLSTSLRRAGRDPAYTPWRGSKFERAGCGASTAKSLSENEFERDGAVDVDELALRTQRIEELPKS
jgi:hypothetical protein